MRLTKQQIIFIKEKVEDIFGSEAVVRLFGSRVDDEMRGGDIDLLIELPKPIERSTRRSMVLSGAFQQEFGAQKIDIIVYATGQPLLSIHREARETGIRL